jgi:hypothetical protein
MTNGKDESYYTGGDNRGFGSLGPKSRAFGEESFEDRLQRVRAGRKDSSSKGDSYKLDKKSSHGYDMISFEVDVVNNAHHIAETVIKKQKDYGPNNIRRSPYGPQQGLVVRLYDKIARLANLTGQNKTPENESLRDTFIDIAGYAIIGLMILDNTFPEEQ